MNITIKRLTLNGTGPTYGVLLKDDIPQCVTLERPWLLNVPDISCIPAGTYQVIPHNSADHANVWEVTGVPSRSEVLIHQGNTIADTKGCILAGTTFYPGGILESVDAVNYLRKILPSAFTLIIINP